MLERILSASPFLSEPYIGKFGIKMLTAVQFGKVRTMAVIDAP